MIRLKNLMFENLENRVNLTKLQTVLEKLYEQLSDSEKKTIHEVFLEMVMMVNNLNSSRYVRTEQGLVEWSVAAASFRQKVSELQEHIFKLSEEKADINCSTTLSVLEELLII